MANNSNGKRKHMVPPQGEGGYDENWYPVAFSDEVGVGQVKGVDFLDGRIVVFRGENGEAAVTSAYCRHVGADLSVGEVIGNEVRCPFHHWKFDQKGKCSAIPTGDPIPPGANLHKFPTREQFGIIWAFNGKTPHEAYPGFQFPEEEIVFKRIEMPEPLPTDPWVPLTNNSDFQHLQTLHKLNINVHEDSFHMKENEMFYDIEFTGEQTGEVFQKCRLIGTNTLCLENTIMGNTTLFLYAGTPTPDGSHRAFMLVGTKKFPPELKEAQDQALEVSAGFYTQLLVEDTPVLTTVRYRPDYLVKADWALAKYLDYLVNYPRSHHSQDLIT